MRYKFKSGHACECRCNPHGCHLVTGKRDRAGCWLSSKPSLDSMLFMHRIAISTFPYCLHVHVLHVSVICERSLRDRPSASPAADLYLKSLGIRTGQAAMVQTEVHHDGCSSNCISINSDCRCSMCKLWVQSMPHE